MEGRQLFTDHCEYLVTAIMSGVYSFSVSRQASDPSVYLIENLGKLHPKSSLVATQDANFDLLKFLKQLPTNSDEKAAVLDEVDPDQSIKLIKFQPSKRRREADGKCLNDIHLATYHVMWNGAKLLAVVAKVNKAASGSPLRTHLFDSSR